MSATSSSSSSSSSSALRAELLVSSSSSSGEGAVFAQISLEGRLQNLASKIKENQEKMDAQAIQMASQDQQIRDLRDTLSKQQARLEELQGAVAEGRGDTVELRREMDELGGKIDRNRKLLFGLGVVAGAGAAVLAKPLFVAVTATV